MQKGSRLIPGTTVDVITWATPSVTTIGLVWSGGVCAGFVWFVVVLFVWFWSCVFGFAAVLYFFNQNKTPTKTTKQTQNANDAMFFGPVKVELSCFLNEFLPIS